MIKSKYHNENHKVIDNVTVNMRN